MSEPEDGKIRPVATKNGAQGQPMEGGSSEPSDASAPDPRVPSTIGVYERPTGLKRYPAWVVALVILMILVSVAFMLFRFVF